MKHFFYFLFFIFLIFMTGCTQERVPAERQKTQINIKKEYMIPKAGSHFTYKIIPANSESEPSITRVKYLHTKDNYVQVYFYQNDEKKPYTYDIFYDDGLNYKQFHSSVFFTGVSEPLEKIDENVNILKDKKAMREFKNSVPGVYFKYPLNKGDKWTSFAGDDFFVIETGKTIKTILGEFTDVTIIKSKLKMGNQNHSVLMYYKTGYGPIMRQYYIDDKLFYSEELIEVKQEAE